MKPAVTIGIITRNRPQFLREAIDSAANQKSELSYEILVVDDGSDDSAAIEALKTIESTGIGVIYRPICGGEAAARNTVIKEMRSDFVLWLDDDDWLAPHALESQWQALSTSNNADVVYGNLIRCANDKKEIERYTYKAIPNELTSYVLLFYSPFPHGGSLVRRSLVEGVGGYDESYKTATDYDLWARAAAANARFQHNPDFHYYYRKHPAALTEVRDDTLFCETNLRVVERLLSLLPLEKLFPMFPWEKETARAEALAHLALTVIYLRYRNHQKALDWVSKIPINANERSILTQCIKEDIEKNYSTTPQKVASSRFLREMFQMAGLSWPR